MNETALLGQLKSVEQERTKLVEDLTRADAALRTMGKTQLRLLKLLDRAVNAIEEECVCAGEDNPTIRRHARVVADIRKEIGTP